MQRKPRIVFPFVEAGMGHIVPMRAVSDAFKKKYGDKCEIVETRFFQDKNLENMRFVEEELIKEVKLHNAKKGRGTSQFILMKIFGYKFSMAFLMKKRYKKGYQDSINYIKELDADLIFNTHFATIYYSCEARKMGLINSKIAAYCPDPIIGEQWDNRVDLMSLSSEIGKAKAEKSYFKNKTVFDVPFPIRKEVENYDKSKEYYRKELGIPEDNFTILLADGAYGAGKLKETVLALSKSNKKMTLIAVCGRNEALKKEFDALKMPDNIFFMPVGFTDKMLMFSAACDLFVGKAGASNLAEPCYFFAPQIVTFCATPIEKWICNHYTHTIKSAVKITNIKKVVNLIEEFIDNPEKMSTLKENCKNGHRTDGPEILADKLYELLIK